jgi:hypothetical protein
MFSRAFKFTIIAHLEALYALVRGPVCIAALFYCGAAFHDMNPVTAFHVSYWIFLASIYPAKWAARLPIVVKRQLVAGPLDLYNANPSRLPLRVEVHPAATEIAAVGVFLALLLIVQ